MLKKIIKIIMSVLIGLGFLIGISFLITYGRTSSINLSVVNPSIKKESQLSSIIEADEDQTIYVLIYDEENADCIYLDEVLLREISNANNEIIFDEIYRVQYKNSAKTYNNQTIKNMYQIETIPAIVKLTKTADVFEVLDKYEWIGQKEKDQQAINDFLIRNNLLK